MKFPSIHYVRSRHKKKKKKKSDNFICVFRYLVQRNNGNINIGYPEFVDTKNIKHDHNRYGKYHDIVNKCVHSNTRFVQHDHVVSSGERHNSRAEHNSGRVEYLINCRVPTTIY